MKVGNLVKIKRASIGIPKNSIALTIKVHHVTGYGNYTLCEVEVCGNSKLKRRRFMKEDLEVISESR